MDGARLFAGIFNCGYAAIDCLGSIGRKVITVSSSENINSYHEITSWRKNIFRTEKLAQNSLIILQSTSMTETIAQKSKARDHQECLAKRLALWKDGKIAELLQEGGTVQKRLVRSHLKKGTST